MDAWGPVWYTRYAGGAIWVFTSISDRRGPRAPPPLLSASGVPPLSICALPARSVTGPLLSPPLAAFAYQQPIEWIWSPKSEVGKFCRPRVFHFLSTLHAAIL